MGEIPETMQLHIQKITGLISRAQHPGASGLLHFSRFGGFPDWTVCSCGIWAWLFGYVRIWWSESQRVAPTSNPECGDWPTHPCDPESSIIDRRRKDERIDACLISLSPPGSTVPNSTWPQCVPSDKQQIKMRRIPPFTVSEAWS